MGHWSYDFSNKPELHQKLLLDSRIVKYVGTRVYRDGFVKNIYNTTSADKYAKAKELLQTVFPNDLSSCIEEFQYLKIEFVPIGKLFRVNLWHDQENIDIFDKDDYLVA